MPALLKERLLNYRALLWSAPAHISTQAAAAQCVVLETGLQSALKSDCRKCLNINVSGPSIVRLLATVRGRGQGKPLFGCAS